MSYTTIPVNEISTKIIAEMQKLFDGAELNEVHKKLDHEYKEQFQVGADSSTNLHSKFYDKYRGGWAEMEELYCELISTVVAPTQSEDFLYQKFPTVRFHIPNNVAVGKFHKDADFNHPLGEINYVLPLTNSNKTASIWVEQNEGQQDYIDMIMQVGKLITFNGNQRRHGNKTNETRFTRCSLDFRILPISFYHPEENAESITTKAKFTDGAYYKRFNK